MTNVNLLLYWGASQNPTRKRTEPKIKASNLADEELLPEDMFSEEPYQAMMEIIKLAFGDKYSISEIEEWLDVAMIPEILEIFNGISNYKKKLKENQAKK